MKAKEGHRYYSDRTRLETVIPLATPYILYCDPSSACNLKCSFCPCGGAHTELWTEEKRKSVGLMDFDIFRKVVDDCAGFPDIVRVLRLYKDGEPLLNPRLAEMVEYAAKSGHFRSIDTTTNGTMLNPKLNREIIKAGLTRIHISVEGLSANEYRNICGREIDYEQFVYNIKDLYEHRGQCHVFVKTIAENCEGESDEEKKKRFYEIFGDICDEIAWEHLSPAWPEYNKELVSDSVGVYGNKIHEVVVCPRLFYIMAINSDGTASRCIVDWNHRMSIGNVRNESVPELWRKMDEFRIEHLKGNRRKLVGCSECLEAETGTIDSIDAYQEELLKRFIVIN